MTQEAIGSCLLLSREHLDCEAGWTICSVMYSQVRLIGSLTTLCTRDRPGCCAPPAATPSPPPRRSTRTTIRSMVASSGTFCRGSRGASRVLITSAHCAVTTSARTGRVTGWTHGSARVRGNHKDRLARRRGTGSRRRGRGGKPSQR